MENERGGGQLNGMRSTSSDWPPGVPKRQSVREKVVRKKFAEEGVVSKKSNKQRKEGGSRPPWNARMEKKNPLSKTNAASGGG